MFTFWSFYMFKVYEKYYVKYVEGSMIKVMNVIATTAVICRGTTVLRLKYRLSALMQEVLQTVSRLPFSEVQINWTID